LGKNSVQKHQKKKKETPSLMIYGTLDDVYPMMLAHKTYESFQALHGNGITFFQTFDKPHRMISGRQEMYQVMKFFANHLYLKNLALENQPDIIEIQPF
jgi:predicted esterase